jgi:A/G-specific adenine glycosylase
MTSVTIQKKPAAAPLLAWYDRHHRDLPWRISPAMAARGVTPDPYHIWLSEVMLQQTTVAAVKAYFAKFVGLWPTVADLAAAPSEDVMVAGGLLRAGPQPEEMRRGGGGCAWRTLSRHGRRLEGASRHR